MHPAFSVIVFTTLSGAGYGLLAVLGLALALDPNPPDRQGALLMLVLALVLVSIGLLSSLLHLGRPERAWRALSQWRSSWLSREGVLALATYLPALVLGWLLWRGGDTAALRAAAIALLPLALATVAATAMIYASLKPIPAWRDWRVLPVYLGYALAGGLALHGAIAALRGAPSAPVGLLLLAVVVVLAALKLGYWSAIRKQVLPEMAHAIGLGPQARARVFEAPHTEGSFITREMVFVLARRHARILRALVLVAGLAAPALLVLAVLASPGSAAVALPSAALLLVAGSVVERWLFFAEARHVVSRYFAG